MSAISEKVRAALYAKLNVASVVGTGKASAVYYDQAGSDPTFPYLVYNRQAPGQTVRTFGQTLVAEDDLWIVKVYTDTLSASPKSAQGLIQEILAVAETAIGTSLTLSAGQTWLVERFSDILLPKEMVSDRIIYAGGFLLRVVVTPS